MPALQRLPPRRTPPGAWMARLCPDAFPSCWPWQDIASMRSRRGLGQEKRQFVAIYRRHVFRFSYFWQDMRAMHPKSPAKCRWGIHRANILPPRDAFAIRSPRIMHGARISPSSDGPAPAQGLLPEQPHRGIAFQRPGPCAGMASHTGRGSRTLLNGLALAQGCLPPSTSPIPATCQYPPLAAPIAVRDKPPMSFGGDHPAHGLQSGQAPRGRRLRHLDGQADNGMLRRTGPGFQNREQVSAEPQAEAAGPAGPASALPKTPIERTNPS